MSREKFDDNCKGCRPVIFDPDTGEKMEKWTAIANRVWDLESTFDERLAFHCVTCLNSRLPADLVLFKQLTRKIEDALKAAQS